MAAAQWWRWVGQRRVRWHGDGAGPPVSGAGGGGEKMAAWRWLGCAEAASVSVAAAEASPELRAAGPLFIFPVWLFLRLDGFQNATNRRPLLLHRVV